MQKLLEAGISTRREVMTTHIEKAYRDDYKDIILPNSEDVADNSILIPLYITIKDKDVEL